MKSLYTAYLRHSGESRNPVDYEVILDSGFRRSNDQWFAKQESHNLGRYNSLILAHFKL